MSTCSHSGATTCSFTCEIAFLKCVKVQTSEETYSAKQLLGEEISKECNYFNVEVVFRESRSVFYLPNKRKSVATVQQWAATTTAGLRIIIAIINQQHRKAPFFNQPIFNQTTNEIINQTNTLNLVDSIRLFEMTNYCLLLCMHWCLFSSEKQQATMCGPNSSGYTGTRRTMNPSR